MTRHVYTYCNSCEKTFWYIGHNDTNQEDDSFQPVVLQNKGNDEKGNPKKYSNTSNDVDEMFNLNSDWSFVRAKTVLSPVCTAIPTQFPSSPFVEKKARFLVSRGF